MICLHITAVSSHPRLSPQDNLRVPVAQLGKRFVLAVAKCHRFDPREQILLKCIALDKSVLNMHKCTESLSIKVLVYSTIRR